MEIPEDSISGSRIKLTKKSKGNGFSRRIKLIKKSKGNEFSNSD